MSRRRAIEHEFVKYVPANLADGRIYVSMEYATASHKCCCGCGQEVVTPLSPTDWKLTFDGETITLNPSIGNWSFPCESHYLIENNQVVWAGKMSRKEVKAGRTLDRQAKERYFGKDVPYRREVKECATNKTVRSAVGPEGQREEPRGLWESFRRIFGNSD